MALPRDRAAALVADDRRSLAELDEVEILDAGAPTFTDAASLTADQVGSAIPQQAKPAYRGGAILDEERGEFQRIEAWKEAELQRAQREYREAKARAAEVGRRHRFRTLGVRRQAHRGLTRQRRPGSCHATGSRRSRTGSRTARARSPGSKSEPPCESDSDRLSPPLAGGAGR